MHNQYLVHDGVVGMRRGQRRYQNPDGTWTEEGKARRRAEAARLRARQGNKSQPVKSAQKPNPNQNTNSAPSRPNRKTSQELDNDIEYEKKLNELNKIQQQRELDRLKYEQEMTNIVKKGRDAELRYQSSLADLKYKDIMNQKLAAEIPKSKGFMSKLMDNVVFPVVRENANNYIRQITKPEDPYRKQERELDLEFKKQNLRKATMDNNWVAQQIQKGTYKGPNNNNNNKKDKRNKNRR